MNIIVYESNSGFTKQYAEMLANKCNSQALSLKQAKKQLKKGSNVFFLGWVFGTRIMGYKKANKRFKLVGAAAVGITNPNSGYKNELIEKNEIKLSNFYYLRGGMDRTKLKGIKAKLINILAKSIARDVAIKQAKKEDRELLRIIENGANFVDENNLTSIIKIVNN